MSFHYDISCSGCCSGGINCIWMSGCRGWVNTYTLPNNNSIILFSGTLEYRPSWTLVRPAPGNSFCSWYDQPNVDFNCGSFSGAIEWIARFDGINPFAPYNNSGNALNCDNTISGLFYGVLFYIDVCVQEIMINAVWFTSGYINSGAFNCSGPTSYFIGYNTDYQGNPVPKSGGLGSAGLPIQLTIFPV